MNVTVLQWNVWFKESADHIIRFLRDTDADILCLQELTTHSEINSGRDIPSEIESLGYHRYYVQTLRKSYRMGNGIFSKFPISNTRHAYVQHEGPDSDDYSKENRVYLEAKVNVNGKLLRFGTVHLSYSQAFEHSSQKEDELRELVKAIQDNKQRFIFTGDLNALPDSETVRRLGSLLRSVGPRHSLATWTTKPFSYDGFAADGLNWRLDYIFASSDIKIADSKILSTAYSDHLPILATIEL